MIYDLNRGEEGKAMEGGNKLIDHHTKLEGVIDFHEAPCPLYKNGILKPKCIRLVFIDIHITQPIKYFVLFHSINLH